MCFRAHLLVSLSAVSYMIILNLLVLPALLEARGLPSHFFGALGALGPRMHQLLHRQIGTGACKYTVECILFKTSLEMLAFLSCRI